MQCNFGKILFHILTPQANSKVPAGRRGRSQVRFPFSFSNVVVQLSFAFVNVTLQYIMFAENLQNLFQDFMFHARSLCIASASFVDPSAVWAFGSRIDNLGSDLITQLLAILSEKRFAIAIV